MREPAFIRNSVSHDAEVPTEAATADSAGEEHDEGFGRKQFLKIEQRHTSRLMCIGLRLIRPAALSRPLIARIGVDLTNANESISPHARYGIHHCRPALALAREDAFVPSPRRHRRRSHGIQVHFPNHDHADSERGPLVTGVAAEALVYRLLWGGRDVLGTPS